MQEYLTYIPEPPQKRALMSQILWEVGYTLLYVLVYLPGLLIRLPSVKTGTKRPVVIVPGFLGQPLAYFKLRSAFAKQGHPVYVVPLGFQMGNIAVKGVKLERYLEKNNIDDCYVIGHSMGGLISLSMNYRGRDKVRKLYLVNSPLKGTIVAFFVPFMIAGLQMTPVSPFIKEITRRFNSFSNLQTIFSRGDEIVVPNRNLRMGRFDDVMFDEVGHLNLGLGRNGIECLCDLVHREEAKDPLPEKVSHGHTKAKLTAA